MIALASILVDIDAGAADHPAVEQAVSLAAGCGARVKIVDVLAEVPPRVRHFVTADLENELIAHRRERLSAIADGVRKVPVATELLRGRPATALIQEVLRSGHDLVVRSHERDLTESPRPFGAIDMELLRQCPCPVWLIGRSGFRAGVHRILAAIHADPTDAVEQSLNNRILEWALTPRAVSDAELTLLQAWVSYGASLLKSRMSPEEFANFLEAARQAEDRALSTFIEPFKDRLTDVAVELVSGPTEDVIATFVGSHGIDMVVMGTVARSGIAGLVMGNTAERVLQRLRGGVLAIKPAGFESPVEPM